MAPDWVRPLINTKRRKARERAQKCKIQIRTCWDVLTALYMGHSIDILVFEERLPKCNIYSFDCEINRMKHSILYWWLH